MCECARGRKESATECFTEIIDRPMDLSLKGPATLALGLLKFELEVPHASKGHIESACKM